MPLVLGCPSGEAQRNCIRIECLAGAFLHLSEQRLFRLSVALTDFFQRYTHGIFEIEVIFAPLWYKTVEKLTEWFKKKSGKTADMGVAFGYDSVLIMADAIKRAMEPNPAKIREALEKTDYFGLTGRVKFDASHHSQPRVSISQVKNGVPQIIYQLKD